MNEPNVFVTQSDALREVLKWLDNCPCDAIISSMAGNIVHIKVDSHIRRSKNGNSSTTAEGRRTGENEQCHNSLRKKK